jgi:hypothetical protein
MAVCNNAAAPGAFKRQWSIDVYSYYCYYYYYY